MEEISKSVFPTKPGKDDVARISIRGNGRDILLQILSKRDEYGNEIRRKDLGLPNVKSKKQKLSKTDKLLIGNYKYLKERVKGLDPDRIVSQWDNLQNRAFVFICVAVNSRTARSLVLGSGKGKNLEPIDEFKALVVCLGSIQEELIQDETMESWNDLEEEVKRPNLESACTIYAQIALKRSLNAKGIGKVDLMEDFLRHHVEKFPTADGASFFKEKIVPCAKTLKCFRNGELRFETENYSNAASLEFLRKAATTTQGGREKQIEMLILGCLMVSEKIDTETGVIKGREFSSRLFKLEQLTLWMMLVPEL